MSQPIIVGIFAFFFGLCIGSFLNVCIYRLPASRSIVRPRSMCLKCGHQLSAADNIPLLSYAVLGGKCRSCGVRISLRYPLVELLSGIMAVAALYRFGLTPPALIYYLFIATLIVIAFIDLDHRIIPDVVTLPGIPIFFLAALFLPEVGVKDSVTGLLAGGGVLFLVAWSYERLTGKEGMGGGDIKLLAMMGTLLGWKGVVFTIFVSSAAGTVVGIPLMLFSRANMKLAIPYGPFLAAGGVAYLFFGPELIGWYFNMLR